MTDGAGKSWSRFISHVCLTTRPVDAGQEPFTDPVALSLGSAIPWWENPIPVSLSLGSAVRRVGSRWQPVRLAAKHEVMHEMDRQLAYYLRLDQNKLTSSEIGNIVRSQFANR